MKRRWKAHPHKCHRPKKPETRLILIFDSQVRHYKIDDSGAHRGRMRHRISAATDPRRGFGCSCKSWPRCALLRPQYSPMSAASRRREAAYGTKRRRSECASFWPLVRIAERGSAFWSAMATEVASGCDQIRVGFRRAWLMSCSFRPGSTGSLDGPGNGLRRR